MTDPTPALLTLSEAAKASGLSRRTIRRRMDAGDLDGATQDAAGRWVIPAASFEAAGISLFAPSPPDTPATMPVDVPEVERLRQELADLRGRAEAAERRAAVAEAVAEERAANLADLRVTLRMLEAGPSPSSEVSDQAVIRRRWWRK